MRGKIEGLSPELICLLGAVPEPGLFLGFPRHPFCSPETLNPKPQTLNPKPQARNIKPLRTQWRALLPSEVAVPGTQPLPAADALAEATASLVGSHAALRLQIAQSRYYLQTLDLNVGLICILGAPGQVEFRNSQRNVGLRVSWASERETARDDGVAECC